MAYPCSVKSKEYNIEFYPMTQHVNGSESPDQYIEKLLDMIHNEFVIDRRFDKENLKKLFDIVIERLP